MLLSTLLVLLVTSLMTRGQVHQCNTTTCTIANNCRCCTDNAAPGGLTGTLTRQMYTSYYAPLFESHTNPNGCPASGTFFIEDDGTDYGMVKDLHDAGHEIGIQSVDGKVSNESDHWNSVFKLVKNKLVDLGLKASDVKGVRLPELMIDGDDEFNGIGLNSLTYDSTCSNIELSTSGSYKWPCTFDYVYDDFKCDNGKAPSKPYPGIWEVMLTDLQSLDPVKTPCVVPSACRNVTTKRDAFDLFFNAFTSHYNGRRTPMNMLIDPAWPTNPDFLDGTVEFLHYVRAAFGDTVWLISIDRMLEWVKQPVSIANAKTFAPWTC